MELSAIIAFSAAVAAGAIAFGVALSAKSLTRWVFVGGMLLLAVESGLLGLANDAFLPQQVARYCYWRLLVLSLIPGAWIAFSVLYAREEGEQAWKKWRWFLISGLALPAMFAWAYRGRLISAIGKPDADSAWEMVFGWPGVLLNSWVLVGGILVLMNLERTYRAAVGTMRWRIKFMIIGLGALFVLRCFGASQVLLFKSLTPGLQTANSMGLLIACLLILRTLLRTGHFEVGIYASQSLLHSSFTVLLAGGYLIFLGMTARLSWNWGGHLGFQLKAFGILASLVLLSILLLSDRARLLSKRFISRHFHRPLYDYRTIWRSFTDRTGRAVDQKTLCAALVAFISETLHALSVSIWVVDGKRERLILGGSTLISGSSQNLAVIDQAGASEVLLGLESKTEAVNLNASKETWASLLRRFHPSQFPSAGGDSFCIPVIAAGELLGCIILADRVGGISYNIQDLELLKAIADQAASNLLNIRLSERLSQARQLEAFQAMSAFFVHDLKNTASTLALMLKNFPMHYQNPDFREDAIRGIGGTLTHLNGLIERLNLLRHQLEVKAVECDLNRLIAETLQERQGCGPIGPVKHLGQIPTVKIDPEQMQKVITNLVLNAQQAVGEQGEITIETSRHNGWIVLGVSDNGCGMSSEFVSKSLFRPFQSTKKSGLGIGMFHCKMIVEAHGGHIEVESQPSKGTQFRVLLPIAAH